MIPIVDMSPRNRPLSAQHISCIAGCYLPGLFIAWILSLNWLQAASNPKSIASLQVHPAFLELRDTHNPHGLLVSAVLQDGSRHDVTRLVSFHSRHPQQLRVSTNGVVHPMAPGSNSIAIVLGSHRAEVPVVIRDPATATERHSFRQEIEPLLTRAGCNMGSCHGKLAGQNGFRLSLRGYAPELDADWLRDEGATRRLEPADPEHSLLVLKATAQVPHEGGQRIIPESRGHQLLVQWIAERAPGPLEIEKDPNPTRIVVLPGDCTLQPGDQQSLLVQAVYPDGHVRDVTWLTQFFSNDEATTSVTPDGLVSGRRHGETAIRAHFQGLVEVVRFSLPYTNTVEEFRFARTKNAIDDAVFAKLKALRIPPSALCLDEVFLRRIQLDLTGTLPSPEEVRRFLEDRTPDKRARLVDELLERPSFVDYWTLLLADLLQNRKERDHDVRGVKGVRSFHGWLHKQVSRNRPWNELVRDLLVASGSVAEHPEIGYFITTVGEKSPVESEAVDSVAQALLGTRIGCARCHNHPLERYTQDDFYHFAAFFSRMFVDRKEPDKSPTELLAMSRDERDRARELDDSGRKLRDSERVLLQSDGNEQETRKREFEKHQREFAERKRRLAESRNQTPVAWQPRTRKNLTAQPLDRTTMEFKPGGDPRVQLADWITSPTNAAFTGAIVNRLWKHFLGVGMVEPVDDLRASNPPSNDALWQLLNREFVAHRYDLKHLMRFIVNSRTYQLSSQTLRGNETETRFYSHYYARRLPAEVLLDAVSSATGVPDTFAGHPVGIRAVQVPEPHLSSYFLSLFGRSERVTACACERNSEVTLPQLLHLQNSEETTRKIRDPGGRLQKWIHWNASREELVEQLYLATLARRPRATELANVLDSFGTAALEEAGADLFWALLNSKEFAFNH